MNISILEIVISFVNIILAFFVFKLSKKNMNAKLYINSYIRKLGENEFVPDWGISLHRDIDFNQKGFPEIPHDESAWELEICNNGDLPATDIFLEYSLTIKKWDFEFGIDEADVINERLFDYKTVNKDIKIDYLAPGGKKVIQIASLSGEFPEADLRVEKLISLEGKFIKKSVIIESYTHPEFFKIADSHHHRQMIGAHK
ncbi:hypothetical protein [Sporosarcina sp. FA9]|uniref:hypothetical protein n=1 Tax=Sporosarcina sp. FA9 TaxID=3413030 RepID=UPI003F657485